MPKIHRIPFKVLDGHPIIPSDAAKTDIAYVEEPGGGFSIVVETLGGNFVFDSSCGVRRLKQNSQVAGDIESSSANDVGSTIWESAKEICLSYVKESLKN